MALPNSILFVCQMNMVRSPIAEGLMRQLYPSVERVESCGLSQGDKEQMVETIMAEIGIDVSDHEPTVLQDYKPENIDVVVAFTPQAFHAAQSYFEGTETEILNWPLPDPGAGSLDVRAMMDSYRAMRDLIKNRILRHFGPSEVK